MHDVKYLVSNFEEANERLNRRGASVPPEIIEYEEERRLIEGKISAERAVLNQESRRVGQLRRSGEMSDEELKVFRSASRERSNELRQKTDIQREVGRKISSIVLGLPNFPADHTPDGWSEKENEEIRIWGSKPCIDFDVQDHQKIGEQLGIIDTEVASKIAGTRFSIMKSKGAALQRALISFMLDQNTARGYKEIAIPYLVNTDAMTGTGQLPKFEHDMFKTKVGGNSMYLSPTAEVQLTNIHSGEVLQEPELPIKYTAYSENFRAEAGSAGKDTGGIFRLHQFPKVELVEIVKPEDSWSELEKLTADAENVLQQLGLHYRVVALCAGDLGFSSSFTYDLEVWLPGQNRYREISSCSNFLDFQARRMNSKFKREVSGKKEIPHTLNGSALAVGRTVIAIMEQYQRENGSVAIPEVLHDYTGFTEIK